MSRSTLLLLVVAAPAAFLVACGSDTTSGTTSTSGTGGSTATTTSGTGGTGGAGGSASATGTGGSAATSTSSTGTGTSSSASGSTGTGMAMGACTNAADLGIAQMKDVKKIAEDCGKTNLGAEPATKNCIKTGTGLSDGCVTCFDDIVQCVVSKCFKECVADPGSAACMTCRDTNCNPAFAACSGLPTN